MEANQVFSAISPMEEVISDQCQVELGENQDVRPITKVAVLEINEANEIRNSGTLSGALRNSGNHERKELKLKQELVKERKAMGGMQ